VAKPKGRTDRVTGEERNSDPPQDRNELLQKKEHLEHRLLDGYIKIDEAELEGRDVTAWETFWISLLHEYETICTDLMKGTDA